MRINRGLLFWGLGFITAGAVALAIQQGILDRDTMAGAWRLWPLILIAIGISLMVARTPAAPLGTALAAVVIGTIVGTAIAVGPGIAVGCGVGIRRIDVSHHLGQAVARSGGSILEAPDGGRDGRGRARAGELLDVQRAVRQQVREAELRGDVDRPADPLGEDQLHQVRDGCSVHRVPPCH